MHLCPTFDDAIDDTLQRNGTIVSAARPKRVHWMDPNMQLYSTNSNNTSTNAKGIKDEKVQSEPAAPVPKSFAFSY
ncbi:hypothetical protein VNO80_16067 [Phaseolus coccineus]|uniref:Uncharacterized protein n=1 Tax=Phaseolus coccineus TaxID=3886 RepID=A0AAN9MLE6_PHACN